jgi:hypothetical protein
MTADDRVTLTYRDFPPEGSELVAPTAARLKADHA